MDICFKFANYSILYEGNVVFSDKLMLDKKADSLEIKFIFYRADFTKISRASGSLSKLLQN